MRFQKKFNKYISDDKYVIGYTTNTNKEFYIDLDDYEKVKKLSWYEDKKGYVVHKDKSMIFLHRFITHAPKGKIVDHINHNKKDNRKDNLRITGYKENSLNRTILPNGISRHKVGNNDYYMVQLNGYRGNYKSYKEALEKRNTIINNEYLIIER